MIKWRELTDNPVDAIVRMQMISYLLSIRKPLMVDYEKYIANEVKGKAVLDIGICEHTMQRIESDTWKHKIVAENSAYCLGIDIDSVLINELLKKGYNVQICDATSETDLGEKYDLVHIGDVIEHVNNPVALLNFAKRHLKPGGKIIVRTPNPYNFNYIHIQKKHGTVVDNMEHIMYICPIHAHEMALRTELVLRNYLVLFPKGFSIKGFLYAGYYILKYRSLRHAWAEIFASPESYTTIYIYEFSNN
ncbi:MAG: methyltransferase domain-containing protein [Bacteroidales bacterium]